MRRAVLAFAGTVLGLVLLLGFKTHSPAVGAPTIALAPARSAPAPAAAKSAGPAATATRTITGSAVDTPYGPVQLQITVTGRRITNITPVQMPNGSYTDQQINSYAVPQLTQEALAAQSAQIQMVSGASFTSQGYVNSLQSALDQIGH